MNDMTSCWQECETCQQKFAWQEVRFRCDCGGLLSIERHTRVWQEIRTRLFDERLSSRKAIDRSGVWRFREVVAPFADSEIITHPEGSTGFYFRPAISAYAGVEDFQLKHEGDNPTGSFKDRGMTVAMTMAKFSGSQAVACASTGNTSAALAAYAAQAGLKGVVFIPEGKVAVGKLGQTLGYGATCMAIKGDFDAAMSLVQEAGQQLGIYLVNSLNPFRIEGQKTIIWEILQDLSWQEPDWIVFPAGNLGNLSAFGKALREAHAAGWIKRIPRLAAVQAQGANPFYQSYQDGFKTRPVVQAETVATAIRIGNPVSFSRAVQSILSTNGVVCQVDDAAIMAAKRCIDGAGVGCEPASACAVAGTKQLVERKVIKPSDKVVGILTGHMLKDPDAILTETAGVAPNGRLVTIEPTLADVERVLGQE